MLLQKRQCSESFSGLVMACNSHVKKRFSLYLLHLKAVLGRDCVLDFSELRHRKMQRKGGKKEENIRVRGVWGTCRGCRIFACQQGSSIAAITHVRALRVHIQNYCRGGVWMCVRAHERARAC